MKDNYIVIYCSEDGDKGIESYSEEELEARLNENYWGKNVKFGTADENLDMFVGIIIIKGNTIIPKAKEVITKYKL